jgi:hypothetical protein
MEKIRYQVETHDEEIQKMDEEELEECIDEMLGEIRSIKKTYKFNGNIYRMTLFSIEHDFEAQEYIDHYRSLPDFYGKDILSKFDISIIQKLNY